MRILIIHDRPSVAEELRDLSLAEGGPACTVEIASDVFEARAKLQATFFDLAVVDLTLPIKAGKGEATLANTEFVLDEIFGGGAARTPGDVIGISLEPGLLEVIKTTIGQHLMGCIHEDAAGAWRGAFKSKVAYIRGVRSSRQMVANSTYDVDVVIVTALDKEARPYQTLFELEASEAFPRAKVFSFRSRDGAMRTGVMHSIGTSGQAPCASATQALLGQFRPRLMLMTGFCGGVQPRLDLGDLCAFRSSSAWDYGKWAEPEGATAPVFQPRPTTLAVDDEGNLASTIRNLIDGSYRPDPRTVGAVATASAGRISTWKLNLGAAGSGSAVVTSPAVLDRITALDENIWAVDMESYAFYYACLHTPVLRPDFMCIKSVADHCNGAKDSKLHDACSMVSAAFAAEIIQRHYFF